jgi:NTP pyrophosphatase (non-canonical NTP hydrolase)
MNNKQYEILRILQEECAELIVIASKCCRFGFDSNHPVSGSNNLEELTQEAGDVLELIRLLVLEGVIQIEDLQKAMPKKNEKLHKYSSIFES